MSLPPRSDFPALERHHRGRPVAYFDGPGGTQVAAPVVAAISRYLIEHNANTHWDFPSSHETDAMLDRARATFGQFFGGDPAGVIFGANMTTLTFHLSRTLAADWGSEDEVVVTELDHHANVDPWRHLGVKVVVVPLLPDNGQLDYDRMREAIGPRTRLVAVGAASNALGTVNQVARVVEWARQVGALSYVDAVHYAPHFLLDVADWGCDFLACSAYKFYGPHVGVLWGRPRLLEQLRPPHLEPAGPGLETGTLNHEGIAG
ncbi:MAG: aminotransferase class V-fold PLP-dependent enzyme, partial [Vulcanimicrobiota bacterium]